mmetsp:Transcript_27959/g.39033  ORF Transcript_27959/g.39033 Transcript_27959/m.39033 type:complete len:157 (+) Transcript_27959:127-597(+)|eukprot:CAMPEP_0185251950 /NCGR_PEP_ID=MMETSP1359-20130426/1227_1 /TAXON_ID=552665 /ORGANISM="Bigelowiella longifila, Strain CCMP242" /LENGTH=156 /DNA_ID=CAMNT_0027834019 /DNA_START=127 /DNA_END=597 /DNA_ORIENTATION=+
MVAKRSAQDAYGAREDGSRPAKIRRKITQDSNHSFEDRAVNSTADEEHSFKNKTFSTVNRKKGKGGGRNWKNLRQTIALENYSKIPSKIPTYASIQVGPSIYPPKKYCDITGFEAKYREPRTRLRYSSASLYQVVKNIPSTLKEKYLKIRGANTKL